MSRPGDQYTCTCPRPRLMVLIGRDQVPVHASFAGDPLSRVYPARCAICHGRYVGPWHIAAAAVQAPARLPERIARLLRP